MEKHVTVQIETRRQLSNIYIIFHLFFCNQKDVVALLLGTICKSSCLGGKAQELNGFGREHGGCPCAPDSEENSCAFSGASGLAAFGGGLGKWLATVPIRI